MRRISTSSLFILFVFLIASTGCKQKQNESGKALTQKASMHASGNQAQEPNTLTTQEKQEGWKLLFDGKSTDGWREVYGDAFPDDGWTVHDNMLTVLESNGRQGGGGGSIVTDEQYSDFELKLDFKITKGANSGIKYFVVENPEYFKDDPNGPSGRGIGLEYQILDDKNHPDAKKGVNGNRTLASLYDMIPAAKDKKVNPIGEWNHARIVSKGHHVEHWVNGEKVLEYERGGDAFMALYDKSKYTKYPNFGLAKKGHILLQDHGTRVSFKNIKIRELN